MKDFIIKTGLAAIIIGGFIALAAVIGLALSLIDKPAQAAEVVTQPVECVVTLHANHREVHEYKGRLK